jgi:DNA-directed RNA polymerase specialized sigma24 family protein
MPDDDAPSSDRWLPAGYDPAAPADDLDPDPDDFVAPADGVNPSPDEMLSAEEVRAYVLLPSTRALVLKQLRRRVHKDQAEDLAQRVLLAATRAKSRPASKEMLKPWLKAIGKHQAARFYARRAKATEAEDAFVMRRETSHAAPSGVKEGRLMARWLFRAVANDPRDAETLDIIRDQVVNGSTLPEIAQERGMDVKSVENRVAHFKVKYAHLRVHYLKQLTKLAIFSILLFSVVAYALYRLKPWLLGDVPGSVAPPVAVTATTPPPPPPSASVFMPAVKPPAPTPPNDSKGAPANGQKAP